MGRSCQLGKTHCHLDDHHQQLLIVICISFIIIKMLIRYMRKMTSIMDSLKPVARIYWEVEEKVTF